MVLPHLLDLMAPAVTGRVTSRACDAPEMVRQVLLSQCDRRASCDDVITKFGETWCQSPELDLALVLELVQVQDELLPLKIQMAVQVLADYTPMETSLSILNYSSDNRASVPHSAPQNCSELDSDRT